MHTSAKFKGRAQVKKIVGEEQMIVGQFIKKSGTEEVQAQSPEALRFIQYLRSRGGLPISRFCLNVP